MPSTTFNTIIIGAVVLFLSIPAYHMWAEKTRIQCIKEASSTEIAAMCTPPDEWAIRRAMRETQ